jgi:hypothetical protein
LGGAINAALAHQSSLGKSAALASHLALQRSFGQSAALVSQAIAQVQRERDQMTELGIDPDDEEEIDRILERYGDLTWAEMISRLQEERATRDV